MGMVERYDSGTWSQTIIRLGPLKSWHNTRDLRTSVRASWSLAWGGKRLVWLRFGREGWEPVDERYQGSHGITVHWRYYFGRRLSVQWGDYARKAKR
jgi:hypothetical protein